MEEGRNAMDYRQFYNLESYLFEVVRPRFHEEGRLSAFDFFCIVIWKANRAKSNIARRLLKLGNPGETLETVVKRLTAELAKSLTTEAKMRCLLQDWAFRLPIASAILTVLHPEELTVYDRRVCDSIEGFHNLGALGSWESIWDGYQEFKKRVEEKGPGELSLRDKDRWLWGKSFSDQLTADLQSGFRAARRRGRRGPHSEAVVTTGGLTTINTLGPGMKSKSFSYRGSMATEVILQHKGNQRIDAALFKAALAEFAGKEVQGGFSMIDPPAGGFGAWVQAKSKDRSLNSINLTPRHASFIAAILCHEAGVVPRLKGNAVWLSFPRCK